jgi:hypothetical protein
VSHSFTSECLVETDRLDPLLNHMAQWRVGIYVVKQQANLVVPTHVTLLKVSQ